MVAIDSLICQSKCGCKMSLTLRHDTVKCQRSSYQSYKYFCYINGISILGRSSNMVNMSGSPGFWGSMVQVMLYLVL